MPRPPVPFVPPRALRQVENLSRFETFRESYQHDVPATLHGFADTYAAHDAADQVRVRRDAQARDAICFEGWSGVTRARAGVRFDLNAHPNLPLNAPYVYVSVTHYVNAHAKSAGRAASQVGGPDGDAVQYFNRFTTVPASTPYRPERVRQHPGIHGIQTAVVTGPAGEEIHTDAHGRVKVQFRWDRLGSNDDQTTCWIRVMQTWSGASFGAFVLPRVGMEVVVSFIDGDPDHPLVTGCVYNGANRGPYDMPAKKMQSGFKSNSYPGGGGFNEFRFDDSKGAEEVWLQGEKDWNTLIKNDLTRDVLHDELQNVIHDRTRTVGHDETLSVTHDRQRLVSNDETVNITMNRTKTVGVNETLNVGVNRVRNVGAMETVTVGAVQNISVGAAQNESIGANRATTIGTQDQLNVAGEQIVSVVQNQTTKIGGDESRRVGGSAKYKVDGSVNDTVKGSRTRTVNSTETVTVAINQTISVGLARQVTVGGAYNVSVVGMTHYETGISHEMVCGDASIKLERDGTITIAGTKVIISGSDEVAVSGAIIKLN